MCGRYENECRGPMVTCFPSGCQIQSLFVDTPWHTSANFAKTRWSIVREAGTQQTPESRDALEFLLKAYSGPIYGHLRRKGFTEMDAQDMTQSFCLDLIQRQFFAVADPQKGKFRTFLLTALDHFLINSWKSQNRQKRGGQTEIIPLEGADENPAHQTSHCDLPLEFDRDWAISTVETALVLLKDECERAGRTELLMELRGSILSMDRVESAEVVANRIGMSTEAVRKARSRLRLRFRQLLSSLLSESLKSPEDVEDEARYLVGILGQRGCNVVQ